MTEPDERATVQQAKTILSEEIEYLRTEGLGDPVAQVTVTAAGSTDSNDTEPRQPFLGEVVHYVSYGTPGGEYDKACRAALITELGHEYNPETGQRCVSLSVHNPTGLFFNRQTPHDGVAPPKESEEGPIGREGGTWHYLDQCGPVRTDRTPQSPGTA